MPSRSPEVPSRPVRPAGLTAWDRELACPGYTLYCHMRGGPTVYLLDMCGEPVKTWDIGIAPHYAELLPDGHVLFLGASPVKGEGIFKQAFLMREITWEGRLVWEFGGLNIHHDFARLSNGNTVVLGREVIPPGVAGGVKGGRPVRGQMWGDLFAEVTPEGKVVWEWHACQHLDPNEDEICPLCDRNEWTHANSCEPLPNGDVLTTFRLTNTVAIVDRKTGRFRWKWGRGELGHPHDPTMLSSGNVLLFDNGMHIPRLPRSRVLEVSPTTNEIVWSYESERYLDFFSPHISGAQRLWNGNTLVCEGDRGRLFEVTPQKEVVWEFYNPNYRKDTIDGRTVHNWVFRARRYPGNFPAFRGRGLAPAI